ncbi:hypothetical protein HAX54_017217 [Datura stramonium]|uniref:Uncharacterized protein n=1 Tax=Datura stramonium TaxID=4076 RepID=A0ABS8UKI0_DATST|nr:hypothetical protein [Datura stramonium]
MDHLIKDCPLLKEEQRKNSEKQQQLASKAFKKAIKAIWGETSNEESEEEDGESNLSLMAKSDTDSGSDSSEENEEELEIGLVPYSTNQKLENSGGTTPEIVVSPEEGAREGTSSDPAPETQNENP